MVSDTLRQERNDCFNNDCRLQARSMIARSPWNQRNARGHRPRLQPAFPRFSGAVISGIRQESENVAARLPYVEARDHIMVSIAQRKRSGPIAFNWLAGLRQYHRCAFAFNRNPDDSTL